MEKPQKVLCKRSLVIGDPFYYDQNGNKIERDNRMMVKGDWYDVVYNEHDNENTFSIIDNQGHRHLHYMYNEEDKKDWPPFCKDYGPRDYAKWFYTPEELELKYKRQLNKQSQRDKIMKLWWKWRISDKIPDGSSGSALKFYEYLQNNLS